jgi:PAS domain S-box-containing protein
LSNTLPPFASWPEPPSIVAARAGVAKTLSLLVAALSVALFVLDRIMGVGLDADSWLSLGLAGAGVFSWYLLKTKRYTGVSWFLAASLLAVVVASAFFYGSVRTINVFLLVVAQVGVGIFLSRQALVWTTVGVILLLALLTWADASGLLLGRPTFEVGMRTWLTQVACLLGVAVMVSLNRTQLRQAQKLHLREAYQRLQAELERDNELERFTRIFKSSPTPIFVQVLRTGHIVDANPAFERVLGYRRKDILNRRDGFLWLDDEQHGVVSHRRRSQGRTEWLPITAVCQNGRLLPLLICSERDDDPDESLVITVLRVPDAAGETHPNPGAGAAIEVEQAPASGPEHRGGVSSV